MSVIEDFQETFSNHPILMTIFIILGTILVIVGGLIAYEISSGFMSWINSTIK